MAVGIVFWICVLIVSVALMRTTFKLLFKFSDDDEYRQTNGSDRPTGTGPAGVTRRHAIASGFVTFNLVALSLGAFWLYIR